MLRILMVTMSLALSATMLPSQAAAQLRLLMLDQAYCEWCDKWDAEVGVVYHRTAEGKQAPLMRTSIFDPLPEGVALARKARYTPTFVLLSKGAEVGRIEGYPGEGFFYGMLQQLLARTAPPENQLSFHENSNEENQE